tara:strand:+ start:1556 stop:1732 length:177 start_codon:yes stop_codon:yes gene_type:complete
MQLTITSNETEHSLQDIVIAVAGFIMSGHSIEDVDEEVLIALKKAIRLELEERQETLH